MCGRGGCEKVGRPTGVWLQGRPDEVHDYHDPDGGCPGNEPERFVSNYRKAGGDIEIANHDHDVVEPFKTGKHRIALGLDFDQISDRSMRR